jgi:hypothetical protein
MNAAARDAPGGTAVGSARWMKGVPHEALLNSLEGLELETWHFWTVLPDRWAPNRL